MATSVPNTTTFSLLDVVAVVGGADLEECFNNATDAHFDPAHITNAWGTKNNLLNFRNYTAQLSSFEFESELKLTGESSYTDFSASQASAQAAWQNWNTYGGLVRGFAVYAIAIGVSRYVYTDSAGTTAVGNGWYFWLDGSTWKLVSVSGGVIDSIANL